MRDHTRLRAFELADRLALETYAATRRFPTEERFGLAAQLRRCAVSVPANIVEGCARPGQAAYVHHLGIAYGSARELEYGISIAIRLGYLVAEPATALAALAAETCRVLNGLIRALHRRGDG